MGARSVRPAGPASSQGDEVRSGIREQRFHYLGTLPSGGMYVERPADRILPEALARGEYCHLLAPRQIGKSSLRLRVTRSLRERGFRCASIDLTSLGSAAATAEQWYFGLVDEVSGALKLRDPMPFWEEHRHVAPGRRWAMYMRAVLREELAGERICILIDEIDAVLTVSFPTDDFFLSIREIFEARSEDESLQRVSFCLIGVTTPDDLIKNKLATPFNVSRRVRLDDFTRVEMDSLAAGLEEMGASPGVLLDAVYRWTSGHPYMTMRTCAALSQRGYIEPGREDAVVDEVMREVFLAHPLDDPNLRYAAQRFDAVGYERPGVLLTDKISLMRRLHEGERIVADLENPLQMELRLCGMVKAVEEGEGEWLRIRNQVFEKVFDKEWLKGKGDRRFLAEAIRKWQESGKKGDYLLRGAALLEVLQRDARLFTEEEREYLVECLDGEGMYISSREDLLRGNAARLDVQVLESKWRFWYEIVRLVLLIGLSLVLSLFLPMNLRVVSYGFIVGFLGLSSFSILNSWRKLRRARERSKSTAEQVIKIHLLVEERLSTLNKCHQILSSLSTKPDPSPQPPR